MIKSDIDLARAKIKEYEKEAEDLEEKGVELSEANAGAPALRMCRLEKDANLEDLLQAYKAYFIASEALLSKQKNTDKGK